MRLPRHRLSTAALVSLPLVLLGGMTAHAATSRSYDPRGDAPASADVTSYTITNGATALGLKAKVANLAKHTDITMYVNHNGPGHYELRTSPVGKGDLVYVRGSSDTPAHCTWSVHRHAGDRSTMVVHLAQACFGDRAGDAWVDFIMWQADGQGEDNVSRSYVPRA